MIKIKKLKYQDVNNSYGWAMSQDVPIDRFRWNQNKSQFNKDFMENCNEHSDERYFLKVEVKYPENLHDLHSD